MSQASNTKNGSGEAPSSALAPIISLGKWNFYFLAKFLLFWKEWIGFHPLENLAFAAFILLPVKSPFWRKVKHVLAALLAVALLYYDSWLPSIGRVYSQAALLSSFDAAYLIELAGRFISIPMLAMLFVAWVAYLLVASRVRLGLIVVASMVGMAIFQQPMEPVAAQVAQPGEQTENKVADGKPDFDNMLRTFYASEAKRSVIFPEPSPEALPFDLIFIHVCSLSWDDIKATGLEQHPLWKRFDYLFTRFNSASSYSGPAAIRIQRATCGQTSNAGLYDVVADQCYLMDSLKRGGFESQLAMNHDGHFDDFIETVQKQRLKVPPMPLEGMPVTQHAFDGAPIYDDLAVLSRWLEKRKKSESPRVALYYNSISLHDGNRLSGVNASLDSMKTYKTRLSTFLDELERFMVALEKSGKRAVVAMIPEHGAAVQGDKMQIPGLREIPSPRITLVPVGIKVIGEGWQRQGETLMIDAETSYLAVTGIIAHMLETSPYTGSGYNPGDYVENLATTPFVSQNDSAVVLRHNDRYYWRQDDEKWGEYF